MSAVLERLAQELRSGGGLLAGAVAGRPAGDARHGATAAAGPRARGREQEYELLVEAVYEGYLLHYGTPRVIATTDPDLALLAGDRLYALGLARLAQLGDVEAIGVLSDVISLCAQSHAAADPALAETVWAAGAHAVGHGPGDDWHALAERARERA
jgi:hypothetical protein